MNFRTYNEYWAHIAMEELVRHGIQDFFIAPGSRSSVLALAAENHPQIKTHMHFDERSLAFFALGHAKKTKTVPAVITTSGSAVVNLFPALVEAHESLTPLLVLTADRPFELLNTGANQAINQQHIFTSYAKYFEVPPAQKKIPAESLLTLIAQAIYEAQTSVVHINWQFQEPLCAIGQNENVETSESIATWLQSTKPYIHFSQNSQQPVLNYENFPEKTLILVSSFTDVSSHSIIKLSEHLNAPIIVDSQHSLRFYDHPHILHQSDLLLRKWSIQPDCLIQFGGDPISKVILQKIQSWQQIQYFQILPQTRKMDSQHQHKTVFYCDGNLWLEQALKTTAQKSQDFLNQYQNYQNQCQNFLKHFFETQKQFSEQKLAYKLSQLLPKKVNLFISSSRPIRDMNQFALAGSQAEVTTNRGASGIEGNIATVAGTTLSTDCPTVAIVGDLATLHDLNSLSLLRQNKKPIVLICVNNDGGGIFSFLPIAQEHPKTFQKIFTTPHNLTFQNFCLGFQLQYQKVSTEEEFAHSFQRALQQNQTHFIEVTSNVNQNLQQYDELLQKWCHG